MKDGKFIEKNGSITNIDVSVNATNQLFDNQIVSLSERKSKSSSGKQIMPKFSMDSDWLSSLEAAKYMRLLGRDGEPCVHSLRNMVCRGRLPYYKPFGRLLFRRSELERFIESTRKGGFACR